ncbi:MAG: hypothetical protein IJZ84_05740 [Lachnospiraceae bacterium]|nr:hypothetical protein [Lachnospiraceae bacterium]
MIISQSLIAAEGYYIPQADVTVYSVEELAYLCIHKGYALDSDFACSELVHWILEQCGCEELAYRLDAILRENGDKNTFVETILRFVGYVSEGEIERIIRDIAEGLSLSGYERKKLDADLMYGRKEYMPAIKAYEELLKIVPQAETDLRAACYYNLAAARAQMFLHEQALDALEESYRLSRNEETLFTWLAVARIHYPVNQYLEVIAGREDLHEISLRLEEKMKKVETSVLTTGAGQELEKLREWMQYGGEDGYYVASGRVLKELCEEYREYY